MNPLHLICAILLPPLGVFLKEGIGNNFWISIVLSLFFYFPGIAFAVYIVAFKK